MCEFMSWVEKGGKVYFLTHDLILNTPRGEIIQKRFYGDGEPIGHSAIRAYFGIRGGKDKECTNFSTPDNFPEPIAEAIKNGEMRGFGCPEGLLLPKIYDEYEAKRMTLYDSIIYWAERKLLNNGYKAERKLPRDEYWDLFAKPENRNPAWV